MEIIDQKILHDSVRWPLSPEYQGALPGETTKERAYAGDIVIADKGGNKKFILQAEYSTNAETYASAGYEPIAVVVVPASHTDDGTARCCGLHFVSGQLDELNMWSDDYTSINSMLFGTLANGTPSGVHAITWEDGINYGVYGTSTIATKITMLGTPASGGTGSNYTGSDPIATIAQYIPAVSPYGSNGVSRNPDLFVEGGITEHMDGFENTQGLIKHATSTYGYYGAGIADIKSFILDMFPAAWNTHLYYTKGTAAGSGDKMGDWYLPAVGELFFIPSRCEQIAEGIKLANGFDSVGEGLAGAITCENTKTTLPVWTSTIYTANSSIQSAFGESITSGHYVYPSSLGATFLVIPFIKI